MSPVQFFTIFCSQPTDIFFGALDMDFLIVFNNSILPIFFIIVLAFIYQRIFRPDIKILANLALALFAPILVFDSMTRHDVSFVDLGIPFVFMILLTGLLIAAGKLLSMLMRLDLRERNSLIMGVSMINVGNFGLPLIHLTFGDEAAALSVIYFVIFNIPLCTLAIYLSSDKSSPRDILLDVLKIPIFHAFLLALVFTWLQIPVPAGVQQGLQLISAGAIPLLIFVLGLQLSAFSWSIIRDKILRLSALVGTATLVRLVVSPVIALGLLSLFQVQGLERAVAVLQTSAPSALLPLMYAIRFNKSPELLAAIIFFTTLFSGISLPLLIQFL